MGFFCAGEVRRKAMRSFLPAGMQEFKVSFLKYVLIYIFVERKASRILKRKRFSSDFSHSEFNKHLCGRRTSYGIDGNSLDFFRIKMYI